MEKYLPRQINRKTSFSPRGEKSATQGEINYLYSNDDNTSDCTIDKPHLDRKVLLYYNYLFLNKSSRSHKSIHLYIKVSSPFSQCRATMSKCNIATYIFTNNSITIILGKLPFFLFPTDTFIIKEWQLFLVFQVIWKNLALKF